MGIYQLSTHPCVSCELRVSPADVGQHILVCCSCREFSYIFFFFYTLNFISSVHAMGFMVLMQNERSVVRNLYDRNCVCERSRRKVCAFSSSEHGELEANFVLFTI